MKPLKYLLLLLLFLPLLFPHLQMHLPLCSEPPLFGIYQGTQIPGADSLTLRSWFSGSFRDAAESGIRDQLGFRRTLIRIHNQLDYSLFRIIHAEGFIAGRHGYLFEEDYIHEYTGKYFIGKAPLDLKVRRLKAVQEELKRRGTCLLVVIEPGKASFFPEYIPRRYRPENRTLTNLDYLKQRMDARGVEYIDLDRWFRAMKDTCRYKLFPEYGMHWSIYSVALTADSLSDYLRTRCGLAVPGVSVGEVEISDSLRGSDRDIADMLNLLVPLPRVTAAYPAVRFDSVKPVLNVIAIADSYFNNLYYDYAPHLFRNTEYWYYNSSLYHGNSYGDTKVDHSNLVSTLPSADLILLMTSEINAHCGFWDFADQAWEALFPPARDSWCYRFTNRIRNERWWFRGMVTQAAAEGTTLEQAIRRNAEYAMWTQFDALENKTHADSVVRIIADIRSIPEWMHKVWRLSRETGRPLQQCLESEAEYVLSTRKP